MPVPKVSLKDQERNPQVRPQRLSLDYSSQPVNSAIEDWCKMYVVFRQVVQGTNHDLSSQQPEKRKHQTLLNHPLFDPRTVKDNLTEDPPKEVVLLLVYQPKLTPT